MAQGGRTVEIVIAARDATRAGFESAKAGARAMAASVAEAQRAADAQWAKAHSLREGGNVGASRAAGVKAMEMNNKAALQRQVADSIAAMEQQAAAEDMAAKAASDRKVKLALGEHRQRMMLDDRYYALTHTQREVELRNLQLYYERLRRQHAGNAQMLAQIDRTHAAEAAAVQGGRTGAFMTPGMARMQLRYAVAGGLGMAGGEAGMIAGSLLTGGVMVTAISASIIAMVKGYQAAKKAAEELAAVQKSHRDFARESAQWLEKISDRPTTDAGRLLQQRADDLKKREQDLLAENKKSWDELGLFGKAYAGWQDILTGDNDFSRAQIQRRRGAEQARRQYLYLERNSLEEEREIMAARGRQRMDDAVTAARIAGMAEGPAKRRVELDRQEELALRKINEAYDEKTRLAERAARSQGLRMSFAEEEGLQAERAAELEGEGRKISELRKNEARRRADEARSQQYELNATRIRIQTDGWAQEKALLDLRYQEDLEAAVRQGRDIIGVIRQYKLDQVELEKRRIESLRSLEQEHELLLIANANRGARREEELARTRRQQRLDNAKDPAERKLIYDINKEEEIAEQKNAADRQKDIEQQVAEARIRLIQDASERERRLLDLRQQQRREAAKGESEEYMASLRQLDEAEQAALGRRPQGRRASLPAVERGFLTRAPGRYDPWAEFNRKQLLAIKAAENGNKINEKTNSLLTVIAEKLKVTDTRTADF